jgi:hypothetical protein
MRRGSCESLDGRHRSRQSISWLQYGCTSLTICVGCSLDTDPLLIGSRIARLSLKDTMGLTPTTRWRWLMASLHPNRHVRETRQWLALKSREELEDLARSFSGPDLMTELRRRGVACKN